MSDGRDSTSVGGHEEPALRRHGMLAWWAENHVAANLLMLFLLIGGAISAWNIRLEVFPLLRTDIISIRVPYLGATPAEVEESVAVRVEEAVASIDGIKRIRSISAEGIGTIFVEVQEYADTDRVLREVEAAVDRIETFPQEIEKPVITELTNRVQVVSVVFSGDVPERTLKTLAERFRDRLTVLENISQAELDAVRKYEISIEVSEQSLRRYGLSFDEVTAAVRRSAMDLPGGSVKTRGGEILLRAKGQRYTGAAYEDVVVLSRPDGTSLLLRDVAEIHDGFEDSDIVTYFDGRPAAVVNVFSVGTESALDVADTVKREVAAYRGQLPAGVGIDTWFDRSLYLRGRIDLLMRNAYLGLILVFLSLTLFLDLRLAFWTTMGIPISFLGAFILLPHLGVTINMISLFAFIVVLGIVVDDAIVVGENIFEHRQRGRSAIDAAIHGVREMAAPVTMAVLTTVVAFVPLLFTEGFMGKIMWTIPVVVVSVLLLSLVEALIVLPSHLAYSKSAGRRGPIGRMQDHVGDALSWVVHGPYMRSLSVAVRWRYLTLAIGLLMLAVTGGFVAGGHIRYEFLPNVDSDTVVATLTMPQGTPREQTRKMVERIEAAAFEASESFNARRPEGAPPLVRHMSTVIGDRPFGRLIDNSAQRTSAAQGESHLAEVTVELLDSEQRESDTESSSQIAAAWRAAVGELPGIESLTFNSSFISAGDAVNIELAHEDTAQLYAAVDDLKDALSQFSGVFDVADSFQPGKVELKLDLTREGRTLGLTLEDLARQVRQGFYGDEVQRIQRGRDDIKVMVRYPKSQRQSLADIDNMRIRLPDGTETPFRYVAKVETGRGYAEIERADRRRIVTVSADVDAAVVSANDVNIQLVNEVLPRLQRKYPGLRFSLEGEQREQRQTMASLSRNFVIALLAIFALLGVQFRSYIQPAIIMSAIPFGLVGAVLGHVVLGHLMYGQTISLSFLSGFGVVALTGVVVNDSLIMIDAINRARADGEPVHAAIMQSGVRRFRPILLTTLTTFCGLTPMLLENSLQARFLVPMAVSLAFGVAFATVITLILVPTLYVILEDIRGLWTSDAAGRSPSLPLPEPRGGE